MGVEGAFFYSSLTMFVFGFFSVVFAFFFRRGFRRLKRVFGEPSVSVFDRTFNIFDPFPQSRRVVDTFLMAVPFLGLAGMGVAFLVFVEVLVNGLLLSAILAIICLNLLFVDGAFEVYHDASVFLKASKDRGFGEGDLKAFGVMKNALSRLSNYYVGLAVVFVVVGALLSSLVPLFLTSFSWLTEGLFGAGPAFGFSPLGTVMLWMLVIVALTLLIRAMKNRFSRSVFAYAASA